MYFNITYHQAPSFANLVVLETKSPGQEDLKKLFAYLKTHPSVAPLSHSDFTTMSSPPEFRRHSWATIQKGEYRGDSCYIYEADNAAGTASIAIIPRLHQPTAVSGSKAALKKSSSSIVSTQPLSATAESEPGVVNPLKRRRTKASAALFDGVKFQHLLGPQIVKSIDDNMQEFEYQQQKFTNGLLCLKVYTVPALRPGARPTAAELSLFAESMFDSRRIDNLLEVSHLRAGDNVRTLPEPSFRARLESIDSERESAWLQPEDPSYPRQELDLHDIERLVRPGDHVEVTAGLHRKKQGFVISVADKEVSIREDGSDTNELVSDIYSY